MSFSLLTTSPSPLPTTTSPSPLPTTTSPSPLPTTTSSSQLTTPPSPSSKTILEYKNELCKEMEEYKLCFSKYILKKHDIDTAATKSLPNTAGVKASPSVVVAGFASDDAMFFKEMMVKSRAFWEKVWSAPFIRDTYTFISDGGGKIVVEKISKFDFISKQEASNRITCLYKDLLGDTLFSMARQVDFEIKYRQKLLDFHLDLESEPESSRDDLLDYLLDDMEEGKIDHSFVKYLVEKKGVSVTPFCYTKALMSVRDYILIDYYRKNEKSEGKFLENLAISIIELYKCVDLEEYIFKLDNMLCRREMSLLETSLDFFFSFQDKYSSDIRSYLEDTTGYDILFTFHFVLGGDLGTVPVYLIK